VSSVEVVSSVMKEDVDAVEVVEVDVQFSETEVETCVSSEIVPKLEEVKVSEINRNAADQRLELRSRPADLETRTMCRTRFRM